MVGPPPSTVLIGYRWTRGSTLVEQCLLPRDARIQILEQYPVRPFECLLVELCVGDLPKYFMQMQLKWVKVTLHKLRGNWEDLLRLVEIESEYLEHGKSVRMRLWLGQVKAVGYIGLWSLNWNRLGVIPYYPPIYLHHNNVYNSQSILYA